ncbi:MAG: diaminopimelate epimerase [Parvularculales bacterium]
MADDFSKISFRKMNGCGNDFVIVDSRRMAGFSPFMMPMFVRDVANREAGIGCDQFILLEEPHKGGDVLMKIYNSDGNPAEACGNGMRCVAHLEMQEKNRERLIVETLWSNSVCEKVGPETVRADMGIPLFKWHEIPLSHEVSDTSRIEFDDIEGITLPTGCAVNAGNPHIVFFVDDLTFTTLELDRVGPLLEHHRLFPEGVNVSFAHTRQEGGVDLKVWERGAGATQACGTGACATLVAGVRLGLTERKVCVFLFGGALDIEWRSENNHVLMTGPVAYDYEGQFDWYNTKRQTGESAP